MSVKQSKVAMRAEYPFKEGYPYITVPAGCNLHEKPSPESIEYPERWSLKDHVSHINTVKPWISCSISIPEDSAVNGEVVSEAWKKRMCYDSAMQLVGHLYGYTPKERKPDVYAAMRAAFDAGRLYGLLEGAADAAKATCQKQTRSLGGKGKRESAKIRHEAIRQWYRHFRGQGMSHRKAFNLIVEMDPLTEFDPDIDDHRGKELTDDPVKKSTVYKVIQPLKNTE